MLFSSTNEFGESLQNSDRVMFVDYGKNGEWIFGIFNPETRTVITVFDTDTCIHTLTRRAVSSWGADPDELWLSQCAAIIALLGHDMNV